MEWYTWILIIIILCIIALLKFKYIWPKLFKQERREYDD
jgi:hypothetical protein